MAEYTKIETAMAIICDLCEKLYLDDFCPEKNDSGKCGWRKYLEEDAADVAPVVRCCDCKYHHDCGTHFCDRLGMDCPDDSEFFCKYGARMDGGVDDGKMD